MNSYDVMQDNHERYPADWSDPMKDIIAVQEMWAQFDTRMHVFEESNKYQYSRKYKKAMKKIAKTGGEKWTVSSPLHERHDSLARNANFLFPSEMEAAYWLERYISSGLFPSASFMCKQADVMKEIKKRTKYDTGH